MNFNIGNVEIGGKHCFVIAEIGNNHNGSFERAQRMVEAAKKIGVDCVKFQVRSMPQVYRQKSLKRDGDDLGTEYILDLLDRFQLTNEQHAKLRKYCEELDILYQ